ncbi:helix-turn-helix domain-containing protein [Nostoc commune NIES-4072]|jgi:transcriptional regulator with XRE-family HTH domain|uniref:Helix-turn-helix domain-containing protein n=1 Tax=Nostoc commune NIES-4072 TaxID=2005467 RepID=A0A2R5FKZ5_NOSCO|nr:helix-turn-helix transcriptional regulator [Nostoc commune]BBD69557.1 helix-turn-helix domain-containing protein [Nostoc commune HK-02]GBG19442.1 helix-turn-helix domain-containing protein [Nostoc commune NIES-4072]
MWLEIRQILMDDQARKRLAEIVIKIRGERSQSQFAMDLGVSLGAVQNWMKGQGMPSAKNLEKIATAAGMNLEELFSQINGDDPKEIYSPKVAEEVMQVARKLDIEQRKRLIKLLIDDI